MYISWCKVSQPFMKNILSAMFMMLNIKIKTCVLNSFSWKNCYKKCTYFNIIEPLFQVHSWS